MNQICSTPMGLLRNEPSFRGVQGVKIAKKTLRATQPLTTIPATPANSPDTQREGASPTSVLPAPVAVPRAFQALPMRHVIASQSDVFDYPPRKIGGSRGQQTKVTSLLGGGQIFGKINETLDKAKSWVMLNMYDFQSPELYPERHCAPDTPGAVEQGTLAQKLVDLHNKGVQVRVILDNSKQQVKPPYSLEPEHNTRMLEFLRKNGIATVTYPREHSRINHTKLLVVDHNHAVVSGMNWGNHSPANHDGGVHIEGPDARNLFHHSFRPDWLTSGGDSKLLPAIQPFRPGKIKVMQTAGADTVQGPKSEIQEGILDQINQAQKSIHAELFVLTNKQVVSRLIEKHHELKAKGQEGVKILVDPGLYFLFPNCRPGIVSLDKAGVPIRFLSADRARDEKLHAKWAVFDRKNVLMGSANWSGVGLEHKSTGWIEPLKEWDEMADALEEEAEEGPPEVARSGVKGNHEMDILIENAPKIADAFAHQACVDFKHSSFPILEKGGDGKFHPVVSEGQRLAMVM